MELGMSVSFWSMIFIGIFVSATLLLIIPELSPLALVLFVLAAFNIESSAISIDKVGLEKGAELRQLADEIDLRERELALEEKELALNKGNSNAEAKDTPLHYYNELAKEGKLYILDENGEMVKIITLPE